jgi:hypothetical protein
MHKIAIAICSLLLTVAAPITAQSAAKPSWLGIWRATLDGVPSVTLTLADDTGELGGTAVFYAVNGKKKQAISIEPHTLLHPKLEGNTLTFQVRRASPTDIITLSVLFTADTKAQLQCLNCGDTHAPIAELLKDTL